MKFYLEETKDVLTELESSQDGLSTQKASENLAKYGKNKLDEGKKVTVLQRFLKELANPMIIILIIAAAVSGVIAFYENEAPTDVFIILFVVILNAVLGVVQESKAEKAIEALKEMTAAQSKVLRDGKQISVKSEELTVGDIIILEAGDAVPADARIIESASLKCEEAALTGESVPVEKFADTVSADKNGDVALGDRTNMVYMGSTVVYGRAVAVVTGVGMSTEMGKIASALTAVQDEQTPLQIKLAQLSKILTWLVLGICLVIFGVGVIRTGSFSFESAVLPSFMVAVSLAVAAIPEGLAAVVTIVLSIGVTRMSKRAAVIRKLTAVETLGCTQIICSDKTGTLTQNKMTVVEEYTADKKLLCYAMSLCSDANLDDNNEAIGEPTEAALVNYAFNNGYDKRDTSKEYVRIGEVPFDSERKMMTTLHNFEGKLTQFTKGAPDEILTRCTHILTEDGIKELTEDDRTDILKQNKGFAYKALRVLAAAVKYPENEPDEYTSDATEKDMIFVGLCGMIDPVRPEVIAAINECKGAGIRPIMITGDHIDTAVAIAKEIGIIKSEKEAITGAMLDLIPDDEFEKAVEKYSVYARVRPEHKVRIVTAWKKKGMVTAMTGDGVNDAPSIKSADIGVGMGITGTDVTKNVADMVLGDDNFATIVYAVGEGRRIYSNIRKAIQFLLSSNMSEVITIFTSTMVGFTVLRAPHLLWINLITDTFPALALGTEPAEEDIMTQKPRSSKEGIFSGGVGVDLAYQGVMVAILTLLAFYLGEFFEMGHWDWTPSTDSTHGMTMAFLTMSLAEVFHSFNMRSQRGSVFKMKKQNKLLLLCMVASIVLTFAVIEIPFLANLFEFAPISWKEYLTSFGLAVSVIPIVETVKFFQRRFSKR
ncbi:MAG: cation-translocating P-type ATPase [Clostridia bacterium]|nr:cation-translocating P-type ATPase [Clostridia bacterium]